MDTAGKKKAKLSAKLKYLPNTSRNPVTLS